MKHIIDLNGTAVELKKIKGITEYWNYYIDSEPNLPPYHLKIELQNRKEYIFNPKSEEWEVHDINDYIIVPQDEYSLNKNYRLVKGKWEDALEF